MSSHFSMTNRGDAPLHIHAMSRDASGRYTHAYLVSIDAGKTKTLSSETNNAFMIHEHMPEHAVLLPRGVPPADIEHPEAVAVDPAAAAEVSSVTEG